jgi:hypothetical protein
MRRSPDDGVVRVEALPPMASARHDVVRGLRVRASPRGERHHPAQGPRVACDRHSGGVRRRWCGSHVPGPGAAQPRRGDRDGRAGAARCDQRALRARYPRTRYIRAPSSAPCLGHPSHAHERPIPSPPRLQRALSSSSTRPSGSAGKEQAGPAYKEEAHRLVCHGPCPSSHRQRRLHPGCPATL